jgi:hypothetical protein
MVPTTPNLASTQVIKTGICDQRYGQRSSCCQALGWLLRACRKRPRRRATDNGDKFSSPHGALETGDYTLSHTRMRGLCITAKSAARLPVRVDAVEKVPNCSAPICLL